MFFHDFLNQAIESKVDVFASECTHHKKLAVEILLYLLYCGRYPLKLCFEFVFLEQVGFVGQEDLWRLVPTMIHELLEPTPDLNQ